MYVADFTADLLGAALQIRRRDLVCGRTPGKFQHPAAVSLRNVAARPYEGSKSFGSILLNEIADLLGPDPILFRQLHFKRPLFRVHRRRFHSAETACTVPERFSAARTSDPAEPYLHVSELSCARQCSHQNQERQPHDEIHLTLRRRDRERPCRRPSGRGSIPQ